MPVIYLIRHAQASFEQDSYDVLSATGERQSELLAGALRERGIRPDRVVAGTLRRQRDTALGCLGALDGRLEAVRRWNEYDTPSILAAHGATKSDDRPLTALGAPAGLTSREFQALLDASLEAWVSAGIIHGRGRPTLITFNDHAHLEPDRALMTFR
jgi:broad specificity phosphatase PhoE